MSTRKTSSSNENGKGDSDEDLIEKKRYKKHFDENIALQYSNMVNKINNVHHQSNPSKNLKREQSHKNVGIGHQVIGTANEFFKCFHFGQQSKTAELKEIIEIDGEDVFCSKRDVLHSKYKIPFKETDSRCEKYYLTLEDIEDSARESEMLLSTQYIRNKSVNHKANSNHLPWMDPRVPPELRQKFTSEVLKFYRQYYISKYGKRLQKSSTLNNSSVEPKRKRIVVNDDSSDSDAEQIVKTTRLKEIGSREKSSTFSGSTPDKSNSNVLQFSTTIGSGKVPALRSSEKVFDRSHQIYHKLGSPMQCTPPPQKRVQQECMVCHMQVDVSDLNTHINKCLDRLSLPVSD